MRLPVDVGGWVERSLERAPEPVYPLTADWSVSVGSLVRAALPGPALLSRPLGLLDRFGAVHLGPDEVGLDGETARWDRVVELRTQPALVMLTGEAVETSLAQYTRYLPPVPGRAWALRRISELLATLGLAVLPEAADVRRLLETADDHPDLAAFTRPVLTQVRHRRALGTGEVSAGVLSVLLQLAFPAALDVATRHAATYGVPVVHEPLADSDLGAVLTRAERWRGVVDGVRGRLGAGPQAP